MDYKLIKEGAELFLGLDGTSYMYRAVLGVYEDPEDGPYIDLTPAELRKLAETAILLAVELERANGQ